MTPILDAFPYPFSKPEAQQLHLTLSQLYTKKDDAILIAQKVGIDTLTIFTEQAPILLWKDILTTAATAGLTRELVQEVHQRLPPRSPVRPFIEILLSNKDKDIQLDSEPRNIDGSPNFIDAHDEVFDHEALLYYDDLTIQIGRVPALIQTLQHLVELAPAVCKMVVFINGNLQYGTGFRIDSDRLLTNWHVLHRHVNAMPATVVTAEFRFEDDGDDGLYTSISIPCDVRSIVSDKHDDWAIISTKEPLLAEWPIIKLSESVAPTKNTTAYIIQHPNGDLKRIGFVRNQVSTFNDRIVHYLTDTQEGSSGAPVFDCHGRLIALHHAGGRPQEIVGKSPVKKNEGIRISRIIAGLKAKGIMIP